MTTALAAVLELVLPMPPIASNRRHGASRHWRAIESEKKKYWAQLDGLQLAKRIPPAPAAPLARASLRSTMYLGAAMDDDNAVIRHKWPLDWLVRNGFLASDRRTCLRWAALPDQVIKRDGNYRLALIITPLQEPDHV